MIGLDFLQALGVFCGYVLLILLFAVVIGRAFRLGGWQDDDPRPGYITDRMRDEL
jgi:hypothetical protein